MTRSACMLDASSSRGKAGLVVEESDRRLDQKLDRTRVPRRAASPMTRWHYIADIVAAVISNLIFAA